MSSPLTGLELHGGNAVLARERLDRCQEPVMDWPEECGRGDRIPEVIVEEVAQATRCLQLRHVGMQVEPVDTAHRERDVLADNVRDVGRHRTLLGGKVNDGTPGGARRCSHRSQHFPVKLRLRRNSYAATSSSWTR